MYIGFQINLATILVITGLALILYGGILAYKFIFFKDYRFKLSSLFLDIMIVLSLIGVFLLTLSPVQGFQLQPVYLSANLVPFNNIMEMFAFSTNETIIRMVGGNIVLFMPFIFFLTLRMAGSFSLLRIILIGITLSLFIETLQLFHPLRQTNVDDVILNSLGVILGVLLALIFKRLTGFRGGKNFG